MVNVLSQPLELILVMLTVNNLVIQPELYVKYVMMAISLKTLYALNLIHFANQAI